MLDVARRRSSLDPALLPGEVLEGKYRIERVLGRGGMGVVLAARNVLLCERVAIKILAQAATAESSARLLMEARAAARLESDHVVRIFDVGSMASGEPYVVMEYLEGLPLSEVLRQKGQLGVSEAVHWVLQASEALAEAHVHGIIHRDVKPANLFLERRRDGSTRIKVLDFGIAKLPEGEGLATTTHPIGSPIYMAPEQLANQKDVDGRVDVWGIGCVLYELLTGQTPFDARSVLELAAKLAVGSYRRAATLRPEVPADLSKIVDRCLEPERGRRFAGLLPLACALRPFAPPAAAALVDRIERVCAMSASRSPGRDDPAALAEQDTDPAGKLSTPALTSSLTLSPRALHGRALRYAAGAALALGLLVGGSLVVRRASLGSVAPLAPLESPAPPLPASTPRPETSDAPPAHDPPVSVGSEMPATRVSASMTRVPPPFETQRAAARRASRQRRAPGVHAPARPGLDAQVRPTPALDAQRNGGKPSEGMSGVPASEVTSVPSALEPLPLDRQPPW